MAQGNGNARGELWALTSFVLLAALLPSSSPVLWNVEIPRPPGKTDFAPCDARRGGHLANLNVTLLLAAAHQGVRESAKYLQKHGFQKSKYENVTWPRLRRRPGARDFETVAYASQFATEYIARRLKLKSDDVHKFVACIDVGETVLSRICPKDLTDDYVCPRKALRYRTADGSCNNFDQPWRGSTFSTLVRLLPARYADGISRPRIATSGSPLPSGRQISQALSGRAASPEEPRATLMLMQWGQFVDHDVSLTTLSVSRSGFPPKCCRPLMSPEDVHPECLAIPVSWRDNFYRKFGSTCLEFSRSAPAAKRDCRLGARDHTNQVTAFIDASAVYGSTTEETNQLRTFRKGMLRTLEVKGSKPLLPPGSEAEILECQERGRNSKCFMAGDSRVNEQPGLTALHTIWAREHNRVAWKLAAVNPGWDDEQLFQEARRIVAAEVQHVTLVEFLPAVLGESVAQIFGLKPAASHYFRGYDPSEEPGVSNVFATAAFRFGHSMVPHAFYRYDKQHRLLLNDTPLHSEFFNPTRLFRPGAVDRLVLGLVNQPAAGMDEQLSPELTNRLFQPQGQDFGLDLMALNVQRGRDHGLAPYVAWRRHCGLQDVRSFQELEQFVGPAASKTLGQLYASVDDMDLFPGGLAEKPVLGGVVGPTFACLIAEQFMRLRRADRFWYENGGLSNSFTADQLREIRKVTLARVLCDNLDEIETIHSRVMEQADQRRNRRQPCTRIPGIDFSFWKH
ncbi:salivary peroxidase/catechol oxidase-like isoform X2 [Haemaphysalis longicornis]